MLSRLASPQGGEIASGVNDANYIDAAAGGPIKNHVVIGGEYSQTCSQIIAGFTHQRLPREEMKLVGERRSQTTCGRHVIAGNVTIDAFESSLARSEMV